MTKKTKMKLFDWKFDKNGKIVITGEFKLNCKIANKPLTK